MAVQDLPRNPTDKNPKDLSLDKLKDYIEQIAAYHVNVYKFTFTTQLTPEHYVKFYEKVEGVLHRLLEITGLHVDPQRTEDGRHNFHEVLLQSLASEKSEFREIFEKQHVHQYLWHAKNLRNDFYNRDHDSRSSLHILGNSAVLYRMDTIMQALRQSWDRASRFKEASHFKGANQQSDFAKLKQDHARLQGKLTEITNELNKKVARASVLLQENNSLTEMLAESNRVVFDTRRQVQGGANEIQDLKNLLGRGIAEIQELQSKLESEVTGNNTLKAQLEARNTPQAISKSYSVIDHEANQRLRRRVEIAEGQVSSIEESLQQERRAHQVAKNFVIELRLDLTGHDHQISQLESYITDLHKELSKEQEARKVAEEREKVAVKERKRFQSQYESLKGWMAEGLKKFGMSPPSADKE